MIDIDCSEIESKYTALLNRVLRYIVFVKKRHPKEPIYNIIEDFCEKYNVDMGVLADAIQDDFYFSSIIKQDCIDKNTIPSRLQNKNPLKLDDDW